jgi:DNA-binding response OmpR family regulator
MVLKLDGLEVCRILRHESDVPIIMLTAKTTDQDKLTGLGLGADDYVTKPFSPKVLVARVWAVLRRLPGERGPEEIKHDELSMNFVKHEAWFAGRPLNLTSIEFKLLGVLAKEPGRVFSRAGLIEEALGYDFEGFDRTIDVHIVNIRRKLEPDPSHPIYIKTVYGVGYKFVGGEQ